MVVVAAFIQYMTNFFNHFVKIVSRITNEHTGKTYFYGLYIGKSKRNISIFLFAIKHYIDLSCRLHQAQFEF
jgi:hypothetical protein